MESISIKATTRDVLGRKTALNLRREDQVPSVMYGGKDILHFYAHEFEFKKIVFTPNVYIINLELDGKTHKCILQDAQYHPLQSDYGFLRQHRCRHDLLRESLYLFWPSHAQQP